MFLHSSVLCCEFSPSLLHLLITTRLKAADAITIVVQIYFIRPKTAAAFELSFYTIVPGNVTGHPIRWDDLRVIVAITHDHHVHPSSNLRTYFVQTHHHHHCLQAQL